MALRLIEIYKTYKKSFSSRRVEALNNVSLEISPGEIYALLGPNGAGKSSLIKIIAGLVTPTRGEILYNDRKWKNHEILGAVLEGTRNVYWRLTPLENLHYFANLRGVSSSTVAKKATALLSELDIEARKKNQSRHLSRGMLQKLAIAAALITDPKIVLLDEPTLGVDVASARKIKEKIRTLAHKEGKIVLLTTHQMELVDRLADRVGIINQGRLIREGTIEDLKKNTRKHLYQITLRGEFSFPPGWKSRFSWKVLESRDNMILFEIDCGSKEGLDQILRVLSAQPCEIITLQQKQDNLEEIFLRSLEIDNQVDHSSSGFGQAGLNGGSQ